LAGLVVGAWPDQPDLASRCNVTDLERLAGQPLAGALRAGAGVLGDEAFLAGARAGLAPRFGGDFDPSDFRRAAGA